MRSLICSACGEFIDPERLFTQSYCRECYNAWRRENGPSFAEMPITEQKKIVVRRQTAELINKRFIRKSPCACCLDDKTIESHHRDYTNPLDIVFLCRKCHQRIGFDEDHESFVNSLPSAKNTLPKDADISFFIGEMYWDGKKVSIRRNGKIFKELEKAA